MNKLTKWLIGIGIATSVIFIVAWILKFWDSPFSSDPANWGVFGDYIGGTLATILAALSFFALMYSVIQQRQAMEREWVLRDDESYAKQAITCWQRAFERVKPIDNKREPRRTRQAWMDCARLLLAAEDLGRGIKTDGFRVLYDSERAHWRAKFYDLFDPEKNLPDSKKIEYFRKGQFGEELEPNSIFEIYRFIKWQENEPDRLSRHNYNWDLSEMGYFWEEEGAKAYLHNLKKKHGPKS